MAETCVNVSEKGSGSQPHDNPDHPLPHRPNPVKVGEAGEPAEVFRRDRATGRGEEAAGARPAV